MVWALLCYHVATTHIRPGANSLLGPVHVQCILSLFRRSSREFRVLTSYCARVNLHKNLNVGYLPSTLQQQST